MSESQVRQAIQRDFPAATSWLSRRVHPREKTTVLSLAVDNLLPDAGPAQVSYILGFTSKRLVQINIVWTSDGRTRARNEGIVAAANTLRDYLLSEHYDSDETVSNRRIAENAILVFRAKRENGRMVLLLLSGIAASGRTDHNGTITPLTLQLSYMRDYLHPDIFRIEQGRF